MNIHYEIIHLSVFYLAMILALMALITDTLCFPSLVFSFIIIIQHLKLIMKNGKIYKNDL